MTLKWGSLKSFCSAARRSAGSTFGCMYPLKSDSGVSSSIGGKTGSGFSASSTGATAAGAARASCFFCDQRARNGCVVGLSSSVIRSIDAAHAALVFVARVALRLFGLRLVVLLGKSAYPRQEFNRQRHAVHFFVAVHPARALVIADRHPLGPRDLVVHAPQHEHFRLR